MDKKNKDFIHLDDVFKGLRQAEEPYQPGAWGEMKSLLDEELPLHTGLASGSSLMRYLIPLLALLLAGTGFYFWHHNAETNLAATVVSGGGSSTPSEPANNTRHKNTIPEKPQTPQSEPSSAIAGSLTRHKTKKEITEPLSTAKKHSKGHTQPNLSSATVNQPGRKTNLQRGANQQPEPKPVTHPNNQGKIQDKTVSGRNRASKPTDTKKIALLSTEELSPAIASIRFTAATKTISKDIIALQQSLPVLEKEQVLQQWKPKLQEPATAHEQLHNVAEDLAAANHLKKVESKGNFPIYKSENGGLYKEQRDTFKRLELARKLPEGYVRNINKPVKPVLDTVSFKQVAKVSFIPLTYAEIKAYHLLRKPDNMPLIPKSRMPNTAASMNTDAAVVNMVPLTHYKVSSRKMDASAISKLLHSANSGLAGLMDGSKPWYISLMLGGNAGLGSPNAYGMQIGANFLYAIAERWTLSLGVKYQNSYYPNFRFWDSAISYGSMHKDKKQVGTVFTGTEYQKQTAVSVNSLARISVPVLLSYNLGRVSLFGGPEFSYFFPMQKETTASLQSRSVSRLAYDNKNPFIDVPYRLNPEKDFRSRFAAGYVFGLSYDFSRKFSIDIRMSQMLWDNAGKYQLDALRNIYHQPSVELNLGFFLGRREKVIYIMDRNR